MGLFIAQEKASLEDASMFSSAVAGAEFNVAVGLSRFGHSVGRRIVKSMKQKGLATLLITYCEDHATGFMLKSKTMVILIYFTVL